MLLPHRTAVTFSGLAPADEPGRQLANARNGGRIYQEIILMQYEKRKPVTRKQRQARRRRERSAQSAKEELNRRRSIGGGKPNELGVSQGQNGEQGNASDPTFATSIGRSAH
jgi:hypothetical protein